MAPTLAPSELKAGKISQYNLITESSHPGYFDCPPVPHLVIVDGQPKYRRVTSSNLKRFETTPEDIARHGNFAVGIDDVNPYNPGSFQKWLDAGQKRSPITFISLPVTEITPESYIAESFRERKATFQDGTPLEKYVHDWSMYKWPINKAANGFYRAGELKKWILDYLKTEDGQDLVEEMGSPDVLGKVKYVGVGRLPPGAIMGVTQMPNGETLVTMAENASELLAEDARVYGIDHDRGSMGRIAVSEELIHAVDPKASEMAVKSFKRDHYKKREAKFRGNPKYHKAEARNKRRVKAIETDIDTMDERYSGRFYQQYARLYKEDPESLEMVLELEAYKRNLEGSEAREYVASRIREISEAVEKRESGLEREVNQTREPNTQESKAQDTSKEAEATADAN